MSTQTNTRTIPTTTYPQLPDFERHLPIALLTQYAVAPIVQQRLRAIEQRAAQANLPVHHSFNAPLFTGTVTIPGPERDWHLMPLAEDPAWNHQHGFPMPKDVIAQLRKIEATGFDFDTLFIAHEVPKLAGYLSGPAQRTALLSPPTSAKARESAASLGNLATTLVQAAFAPLLVARAVGAGAATVAVGGAAIAAGLLVNLDPIVFGVISDPERGLKPGESAAWVYLCHWAWE